MSSAEISECKKVGRESGEKGRDREIERRKEGGK